MKQLLVRLAQWIIKTYADQSYKGPTFTVYRLGEKRARLRHSRNFNRDLVIEAGKSDQHKMLDEILSYYGKPRNHKAIV